MKARQNMPLNVWNKFKVPEQKSCPTRVEKLDRNPIFEDIPRMSPIPGVTGSTQNYLT